MLVNGAENAGSQVGGGGGGVGMCREEVGGFLKESAERCIVGFECFENRVVAGLDVKLCCSEEIDYTADVMVLRFFQLLADR